MALRTFFILAALGATPVLPRVPLPEFHHLHLRVDDPAAAMNTYARANNCSKLILQGLGVGVRCGRFYLLFDRNDQPPAKTTTRGRVTVTGKGDAAKIRVELAVNDPSVVGRWLAGAIGVPHTPTISFVRAVAATLPDEITHIAYSRAQPEMTPTMVDGPDGLILEWVRWENSGPDAFWCPMHPDQRSSSAGACPICNMTLVAMPTLILGDYRMQARVTAPGEQPTRAHLTLRITDSLGAPATSLLTVHERKLHVFVVGADLESFEHVHPEAGSNGTFDVDVNLPAPGAYGIYADFYPVGGTPQMLQAIVARPDHRGSLLPRTAGLRADDSAPKAIGGARVSLSAPALRAGREQLLTFSLADAGTGAAVTDLEPYLGAAGHMFIVNGDLTDPDHSHPMEFAAKGPDVTFAVTFPRPGTYKVWAQFQRAGRVLTVPFVVDVK